MKIKHKSRPLLLGYLERIASQAFEEFPRQITELIGDRHGVYALYKGDHLYYVGLATNLRSRIQQHQNDRHAGKWDRFSLYLVRKADHIKELESLILRVAVPKGNATKGKLNHAENLQNILDNKIRQQQDRQRRNVMGITTDIRKYRQSGGSRQPTLAPFIRRPIIIRARYKGDTYTALVRRDGSIRFAGKNYTSPSVAGSAVVKRLTCNGWTFWEYERASGVWVKLDKLRT